MGIDVLERKEFIERVLKIVEVLSDEKKSGCFAIDGGWGAGKSFVLDMLITELREIQCEETCDNKYFIFQYNCWKYDYYSEPSIAIVSAMLDSIENEIKLFEGNTGATASWKMIKGKLFEIGGEFIKNQIGVDVVKIYQEFKDNKKQIEEEKNEFDKLYAFKKTLDKVRDLLEEIAKNKTVVIIVDELDRCVPEYAIKVLERLHHMFEGIPNIILVIAIDETQLEHSIKQIYGSETSVQRYLKKFISFSIILDNGKVKTGVLEKYSSYFSHFNLGSEADIKYIEENISSIMEGLEIRQQEKILEKAELVHSIVCSEIVDSAICMFEIMVVRYLELKFRTSLKWIPEINKSDYVELKKLLSEKHIEFLKKLEGQVGGGHYVISEEKKKKIRNHINDKVFLYFASCCGNQTQYFYEDLSKHSKELEVAENFYKVAQALS